MLPPAGGQTTKCSIPSEFCKIVSKNPYVFNCYLVPALRTSDLEHQVFLNQKLRNQFRYDISSLTINCYWKNPCVRN